MSFVNRVLYIPTDYAEFFPLAKCANVRACQKEDSSRKREGIRNKEREEGERSRDGAVCFAYRSAKIPRATTRSGANNIRRESQRRRDERTEKLLSFSLSFSRYVRSFRSGVNIYARAITAHLNETSVPIVYDEDGSGG